jgi:hypothetical protein
VIGLAVGIPIAVLTLVGIGVALLFWLHSRGNSANKDVELPDRQDHQDHQDQDDGAYGDVDAVRRGHVKEEKDKAEDESARYSDLGFDADPEDPRYGSL